MVQILLVKEIDSLVCQVFRQTAICPHVLWMMT